MIRPYAVRAMLQCKINIESTPNKAIYLLLQCSKRGPRILEAREEDIHLTEVFHVAV